MENQQVERVFAYSGGLEVTDGKIIDDTAINSAAQSTVFVAQNYNTLTLEIEHTNSSATAVTLFIESTRDNSAFYRAQSQALSSGTSTLSDLTYSKAVSGDDQWQINTPINARWLRVTVLGTGADGNDKATVYARLGNT